MYNELEREVLVSQIIPNTSLDDFFLECISESSKKLKIELTPFANSYLANLLSSFGNQKDLDSSPNQKTLAEHLKEALEAPDTERPTILKKMGDQAVCTAGFFSDWIEKKTISIDYYIGMGQNAYSSLSTLTKKKAQTAKSELFAELADKIEGIIELITDISYAGHLKSNQDLLSLYEKWSKNQSKVLFHLLKEKGILPHSEFNQDFQ